MNIIIIVCQQNSYSRCHLIIIIIIIVTIIISYHYYYYYNCYHYYPRCYELMISSSDIDECVGSPCKNGATCQNIPGSHKCNCKPGFTGRDCEKGELNQNDSSYLLHK